MWGCGDVDIIIHVLKCEVCVSYGVCVCHPFLNRPSPPPPPPPHTHTPHTHTHTLTHTHTHTHPPHPHTHTLTPSPPHPPQLTIPFQSVQAITKEKTALVIPNAIQISTSADRYGFSSLVNRDVTYNIVFKCWQNHLLNQVRV